MMGVPADVLVSTVECYNHFCETGIDEDFNKSEKYLTPIATPPFYFQDEGNMVLVTVGGLRVDAENRVLARANGLAIDGLYAVGNVSGSMFDNYLPAPHQRREPWPLPDLWLPCWQKARGHRVRVDVCPNTPLPEEGTGRLRILTWRPQAQLWAAPAAFLVIIFHREPPWPRLRAQAV